VIDGMVSGFWEVDPRADGGVWTTFDVLPKKLQDRIDGVIDATARFLLDDLGHARSFSLDTMDEVQKRADALRPKKAKSKSKANAKAKAKAKPKAAKRTRRR
jgi:hypothetical protein